MKKRSRHLLPVLFFCCVAGCATGGGNKNIQNHGQADALRQLGEAYLGEQNYTQALSKFLEAEELTPEDYLLQQDLGIAYMAKGDLEAAVHHFKNALEIKPDYAVARNNLGAAYLAMEDWDSAIACFKLLTKDLLYATPHYPLANLGQAYYEKKEYSEAEKYFKEALEMEPGFANALFGLGKTYLAQGEVRKAAEYFEMAVKSAPNNAEAQFELADSSRLLGDLDKAAAAYNRVIELSPNSDLAREAKRELFDLK